MAEGEKLGEVYVKIKADVEELESQVKKLKGKLDDDGKKMGSSFGNSFKSLAISTFASLAVVRFFGDSIKMAQEAAKAVAKVEQAIKTTGGAAGFSSKELQKMASELQAISGIGDDKILNDVSAQLLTFTNITGESFKRAQVAALDLSTVIGSDLKSQTIQLGKALEDPIAGVGALSRVGITFTDVQKEQIKGFISQNDLLSAQNVILSEVETKYGGQAKAAADAMGGTMQFAESLGDLQEKIGDEVIPVMTELIQLFQPMVDKANDSTESMSKLGLAFKGVGAIVAILVGMFNVITSTLGTLVGGAIAAANILASGFSAESIDIYNKTWKAGFKSIADDAKSMTEAVNGIIEATKRASGEEVKVKVGGSVSSSKGEEDGSEKKDSTLKSYYEKRKFLAKGYEDYKKKQIEESYKAMIKAGVSEVEAEKEKNLELKKLSDAKKQFESAYEGKGFKYEVDKNPIIKPLSEEAKKQYEEEQALLLEKEVEFLEALIAIREEGQIKTSELAFAGFDAMSSGFSQMFDEFVTIQTNSNNVLARGFTSMANAFTQAVTQMIAKWLAMQAIMGIGKLIGFDVSSILAPAGHSGGTFLGTSSGVKKIAGYAGGGDFIVPSGFPNDSYPMLVESGERVQVTPAGKASNTDSLLKDLITSVRAMNLNQTNSKPMVIINSDVDGLKFTKNVTYRNSNILGNSGVKESDY